MTRNDEPAINLDHMIRWLFRYWPVLLLALVIGASIGFGYAAYKNTCLKNYDPLVVIESKKGKLTYKEVEEVDNVANGMEYAESRKRALNDALMSSNYNGEDLEDAIKQADYWTNKYNEQKSKITDFSNDQKAYFDALNYDPDKGPKFTNYVTASVICAVVLFILVSWFFCIRYISLPAIKAPSDLNYMYDIQILRNIKSHETDVDILSTDLSILLDKNSIKKMAIIFNESTDSEKKISEQLLDKLSAASENCSFSLIGSSTSPDALKELSACDSAIILVTIMKTLRSDISEKVSYCNRYNCKVMGFVTI